MQIKDCKTAFFISIAIAAFIYGCVSARYELFPFPVIVEAHRAATELRTNWQSYRGRIPTRWMRPAQKPGKGVTTNSLGPANHELILVNSLFGKDIEFRLLRRDGSAVHVWPIRYLDIWSASEQRALQMTPFRNWDVGTMGALLQSDGSIVFTFNNAGIAKIDRCGRIVWKHAYRTHHSIFESDDGTIWVPGTRRIYQKLETTSSPPLVGPLIEDSIMQLDPNGVILRDISVPELMMKNGLESLLLANGVSVPTNLTDDYTHLNKIAVLKKSEAASFPMFAAGDVIASLRNLNLVFVFDPRTAKIKWTQTGPWLRQHDAGFAPGGKISVFDNHTDNDSGRLFGGSRIVQMDPASRAITVVYRGTATEPFYSDLEGNHLYLAGGGLLISESMAGRIFQIDANKRIVWEYVNRYDTDRVIAETNAYGMFDPAFVRVGNWQCPNDQRIGDP